jgi:ketosteroid isomerase-like protein
MLSRMQCAVLIAATVVTALGLCALAPEDRSPEQAVKEVLDRQVAEWNRGNLDGFLETYWHSPKVVFQSGVDRSDGWDAMRERYRKRYQSEGREMGHLDFSGLEIVTLGPESAFARGRWKLTLSDGKTPAGLFTVILRKLPEGWRIIHDHTSG